jgi:hypothetical protein
MAGEAVDEKAPRDLKLNTRTVPRRTSMVKLSGDAQTEVKDLTIGNRLSGGQEADAASICFKYLSVVALD